MGFSIGDQIWYARASRGETQVICPDCLGTRRIRLILGNDEQVSIDCGGCSRGYEGSFGTITEWKFKADVRSAIIDGVEQSRDKTTYRINSFQGGYYSFDSSDIFGSQEEANIRCRELIKEAVDQERDRLLKKEKDTRSWAWNASYHRRCIREAEKQLAYHRAKLAVADAKKKEAVA